MSGEDTVYGPNHLGLKYKASENCSVHQLPHLEVNNKLKHLMKEINATKAALSACLFITAYVK